MRDHTTKEKAKITAGAISAVAIVGLLAVVALAFLWTPPTIRKRPPTEPASSDRQITNDDGAANHSGGRGLCPSHNGGPDHRDGPTHDRRHDHGRP
jgi:hypothetical protein